MLSVTPFQNKVYQACRMIPKGYVASYKDIASLLGKPAYQAIGSALNRNPFAPAVPCHRVVNADGRIGGFAQGTKKKAELLRKEGVIVIDGMIDKRFFWKPLICDL